MPGENSSEERGRGIFSPSDRDYLRDPETYREQNSRGAISKRRSTIQDRLHNGVLDLALLTTTTDLPLDETLDSLQREELIGLAAALYKAAGSEYQLSSIVETAVADVQRDYGVAVDVDVSITVTASEGNERVSSDVE